MRMMTEDRREHFREHFAQRPPRHPSPSRLKRSAPPLDPDAFESESESVVV